MTGWLVAREKCISTFKWQPSGAVFPTAAAVAFYRPSTDSIQLPPRDPVFAAEQVDGFAPPVIETPATLVPPIERAEAFAANTGASTTHAGRRAFYRPSTDSIQLPPREAFIGSPRSTAAEACYSTLLYELTHYTSHESRWNKSSPPSGRKSTHATVRIWEAGSEQGPAGRNLLGGRNVKRSQGGDGRAGD